MVLLKKIKPYQDRIDHFISEPDKGIYDAMNKGLKLATGDIVGILNSDDFYVNNSIISRIVSYFEKTRVDLVFGDIVYVNSQNLDKITRYYSSANFTPKKICLGLDASSS